jgi:hypothetical protein
VPDVEGADVIDLGHFAHEPLDPCGPLAEAPPGHLEPCVGDVQHGQPTQPKVEQVIDEEAGPTPDVHHARRALGHSPPHQAPGYDRVGLVPAELHRPTGRVHALPVVAGIHLAQDTPALPRRGPRAGTLSPPMITDADR